MSSEVIYHLFLADQPSVASFHAVGMYPILSEHRISQNITPPPPVYRPPQISPPFPYTPVLFHV